MFAPMSSRQASSQVPDRNLAMELVRVTEAAAMAATRWMGRGDKNGADGAAVEAMRTVLSSVAMDGIIVIGEGEKDEAPMLYNGERVGNGDAPLVDVAVDPIDGTTLTSLGRGNAIAVIAVAEKDTMFNPGPCVYMEKIAVGPEGAGAIDITASPSANLRWLAKATGRSVRDLTAVILDRVLTHNDLVATDNCYFAATGITDGELVKGVHFNRNGCTTESLVMRSRSGTVRLVQAHHRLDKINHFGAGQD